MTHRQIKELPPAEKFRTLYQEDRHGNIGVGMLLKSMTDELYRLGTEIAASRAREAERKIDERMKPQKIWLVRDKSRYIYGAFVSKEEAKEYMDRYPNRAMEFRVLEMEVRQ